MLWHPMPSQNSSTMHSPDHKAQDPTSIQNGPGPCERDVPVMKGNAGDNRQAMPTIVSCLNSSHIINV